MTKTQKKAASIICYDGEPVEGMPAPTPMPGDPAPPAAPEKTFSQEDLNKILADDKRKHQDRIKTLEAGYENILADKNLASEQRESMENELADLQASLRTKEQQAEFERKKAKEAHSEALDTQTKRADHWETLYKDEKVHRSLQDAASGAEAFNSQQIVGLLRPYTELKEVDGALTPMIDFPDVDEKTGEEIRTLRTPQDAVKRMKDLPKIYGNLFKSNVVSGVGSGSGGGSTGGSSDVDVAALSPEQYREMREKNPERLGLPKRRLR